MSIYRIEMSLNGLACARFIEKRADNVVFIFDNSAACIFDKIAAMGIRALIEDSVNAHLVDLTQGQPLSEVRPNFQPNAHVLVFG